MWDVDRLQVCMEFAVTSWHSTKYYRLDQTIIDLTGGVWDILLVGIWLGVIGLKRTGFACFLNIFWGSGGEVVVGWYDLVNIESFLANDGCIMMSAVSSHMARIALVLLREQNCVA